MRAQWLIEPEIAVSPKPTRSGWSDEREIDVSGLRRKLRTVSNSAATAGLQGIRGTMNCDISASSWPTLLSVSLVSVHTRILH
ncbi:MAG: hypothetical protein DMG70_31610 [Acidobacteria bacterium]|nr:MAG: hypothetical protein DMG70_31610 [Acidobacteriota bacterium]PYY06447.1 MAG: hypothetical protein DMG69_23490 [Acidobacteriota bacterium]